MPKLTITASNLNRFKVGDSASQLFIKSIQWQSCKDLELVIADGGSDNYEEIKEYFEKHEGSIPMRIVRHKVDLFSRSLLNNVGVRNAKSDYIGTTDVDMMFSKDFVSEVMENVGKNVLVESRTMYWKQPMADQIYSNKIDPYTDLEKCKIGRIKKRTSAGGFQCMHIDSWKKLHGFDERYKVWGSEDYDLLKRASMAGMKIKWIGESLEKISLFHQPHAKEDIKRDLEWQEKNKKFLHNIKQYQANPDGLWGGVNDGI